MLYYLYSLLTAPGVMAHELAHAFFCVLTGTKIFKICLFRFGNPAGYVQHAEANKFWKSFLISFGPLTINSILAIFLFSLFKSPYWNWPVWVFLWLGLAIGLHAIPSFGDAKTLLSTANHRFWRNPFVALAYPFILFLYILNVLKRLRIDIIYVAVLFWLGRLYL
ncbi:MAG: hypothetical protein COU31_03020 [Candidatus Magasanikbacteria bacterium CG10_big_fil_rev_8_21_14_0_10_40_10]|uniref:DUF3267 domain-containing protein n=1 Tax=Candidatus Magasanikbacteria bacterium CG10_big_fil_rev_8_21_14_0_10_40_10 TaxID=1974648 RepID=A0A2M6W3P3_9BACT|nr:MAG: hypothetical protein COU31_03020 [Candidatus Magasanikbacteria bacterium CG10_big_fil_rev_8_21_14_0_10_40_10]